MLCPITFRIKRFRDANHIPVKDLRLEHNWLVIRQLIVFAGNFLALIYGLMILVSMKWFANESHKRDPFCLQILNNAFETDIYLLIIVSFGCASIFIKSHCRDFVSNFTDSLNQREFNEEKVIKIVRYSGGDPQTLFDSILNYCRKKWKLLKRCFLLSPIFTLNAILIISLMPFEFSVVKKCIHYLIENRLDMKMAYKENSNQLLLVLCLNVLFISLILIHLIVFIYVCDLINTSLVKHSQRKQYTQELAQRSRSPTVKRQLQNQMRIEALRQKNILFHQFLEQRSSQTFPEFLSQMGTRISTEVSTIAITNSHLPDRTSNGYMRASVANSLYSSYI